MLINLLDFAAELGKVSAVMLVEQHLGLEEAAKIVEAEAKRRIGRDDNGWPPLAQATIDYKSEHGFTGRVSATDPVLRTGELRDSIEHTVGELEAVVGTDNDHAIYQELGTSKAPPRPFLGPAAIAKSDEIALEIGAHIIKSFVR